MINLYIRVLKLVKSRTAASQKPQFYSAWISMLKTEIQQSIICAKACEACQFIIENNSMVRVGDFPITKAAACLVTCTMLSEIWLSISKNIFSALIKHVKF